MNLKEHQVVELFLNAQKLHQQEPNINQNLEFNKIFKQLTEHIHKFFPNEEKEFIYELTLYTIKNCDLTKWNYKSYLFYRKRSFKTLEYKKETRRKNIYTFDDNAINNAEFNVLPDLEPQDILVATNQLDYRYLNTLNHIIAGTQPDDISPKAWRERKNRCRKALKELLCLD